MEKEKLRESTQNESNGLHIDYIMYPLCTRKWSTLMTKDLVAWVDTVQSIPLSSECQTREANKHLWQWRYLFPLERPDTQSKPYRKGYCWNCNLSADNELGTERPVSQDHHQASTEAKRRFLILSDPLWLALSDIQGSHKKINKINLGWFHVWRATNPDSLKYTY